ncbi:MAG: hypothetical protein CBD80_000250 [Flavobacteriaceae bacterium TMED220]|nr:MAG: hypothetical protein CBD80_000250 [Flavobacteriaceae bacterium TMED220]
MCLKTFSIGVFNTLSEKKTLLISELSKLNKGSFFLFSQIESSNSLGKKKGYLFFKSTISSSFELKNSLSNRSIWISNGTEEKSGFNFSEDSHFINKKLIKINIIGTIKSFIN